RFGKWDHETESAVPQRQQQLVSELIELGTRESDEVAKRFPRVQRRVGGYNLDVLSAESGSSLNLAQLLVGSEGTLAVSSQITLNLQPIPEHKVLGVCHFPTFYQAMETTQHLVELEPDAVELVDQTMLELAAEIPQFKEKLKRFVKGKPGSLLLVEFAGTELSLLKLKLKELDELMEAHGFPAAVVEAIDPKLQKEVWDVRKSGLNIMMSMKGDGKPVSCIEDCAVELSDLAEYTSRLNELFEKYGTTGTWYAHASVGCLHVRPVLNLKQEMDARKLRAITEETFAIVQEYKGSHSGEHGDGLVRSEFHELMYGKRIVKAFEEIKRILDPRSLLNPGKIVKPSKMDDRNLFRYGPEYLQSDITPGLDWSEWGGFDRAVEMCNNNGACRKFNTEVMCPSYRVTLDERHLTRGRANALRLALSGQLGPEAISSEEMYETMRLCVGCKACRRECPTGVDMNRMKTEFLFHYHRKHGLSLREKLFAFMPRYAPLVSKFGGLANLRDLIPGLPVITDKLLGLTKRRELPRWDSRPFIPEEASKKTAGPEVVLLADTFSTYFEPQVLRDGLALIESYGRRVITPAVRNSSRRLCCG
ncbi:MAG: 4Fe-4S dicluster domain-containing protein, partial [SAR324 cluster bacterium]|nr:4Fe-4S dicluster domain-containing protein [SAR324 cluster bacterium]